MFGDSLSSAYGISPTKGWVNLLSERLSSQGYNITVVNSSISGETTGGGLRRLEDELQLNNPDYLIIGLGSNDGLRGYPIKRITNNIKLMIEIAGNRNIKVVLIGFLLPTNYGPKYTDQFYKVFETQAETEDVTFIPFILREIALDKDLMQDDNLHPNEKAQPIMLDLVWPHIEKLLTKS